MTIEEMMMAAVEGRRHAESGPAGRIVCIRLADAAVVDDDELAYGQCSYRTSGTARTR